VSQQGQVVAAAGGKALLTSDAKGGNRAVESRAVQCVLTRDLTEDPYYIAGEKLRRDIREGHPGTLLTLRLIVLNASTGKPIKSAAVDIWHADAAGNYSAFGSDTSSRTFLRGIQKTDKNGLAVFATIYPGWYRGRAVHIHIKVHIGGSVVLHGPAVLPGRADAGRLQSRAVCLAWEPRHPERERLHFRQRRQARAAQPEEERHRLRRDDRDGRAQVGRTALALFPHVDKR